MLEGKALQLANAVTMLADSEDGRELLRWLLDTSGLLRSACCPQDMGQAGYREGRRDMGARVMEIVRAANLPAHAMAEIFKEDDNG